MPARPARVQPAETECVHNQPSFSVFFEGGRQNLLARRRRLEPERVVNPALIGRATRSPRRLPAPPLGRCKDHSYFIIETKDKILPGRHVTAVPPVHVPEYTRRV